MYFEEERVFNLENDPQKRGWSQKFKAIKISCEMANEKQCKSLFVCDFGTLHQCDISTDKL